MFDDFDTQEQVEEVFGPEDVEPSDHEEGSDDDYDDAQRFDEMQTAEDYNRFEEEQVFQDQILERFDDERESRFENDEQLDPAEHQEIEREDFLSNRDTGDE